MKRTIAVTQAGVGMVLVDALHDSSGAVLLPAGCVLTAAMLQALERRGVASVSVDSAAESEPADHLDESDIAVSAADIAARIDHVFRRGDGAAHTALKAALTTFKLQNKS